MGLAQKAGQLILRRVEITLSGPDPSEEDEESLRIERMVRYFFRSELKDAVREIERALPEGFEIETLNL